MTFNAWISISSKKFIDTLSVAKRKYLLIRCFRWIFFVNYPGSPSWQWVAAWRAVRESQSLVYASPNFQVLSGNFCKQLFARCCRACFPINLGNNNASNRKKTLDSWRGSSSTVVPVSSLTVFEHISTTPTVHPVDCTKRFDLFVDITNLEPGNVCLS